MSRHRGVLALLVAVGCARAPMQFSTGGQDVPAEQGQRLSFTFDQTPAEKMPPELINVLGDWVVTAEHQLRQEGAFGSGDYPRVIVKDVTFADFSLAVRCKSETGKVDQACGVMFRLKDSDNYLLVRGNALENNVRFYRVVNGDRQQLASADLQIIAADWHTLAVTMHGRRVTVRWDNAEILTADDATFEGGKVGLWTKADSVTTFDDLEVIAE